MEIFTINDCVKLCNLFNCDIGHLLGEYETKKHIAADIQNETGLSEKAIDILKKNKRYAPTNSLISTLSFLIEQETPLAMSGDFLTIDDSGALLSKMDIFFRTKFGKDYMCSVTTQGVKQIERPEDIMRYAADTKSILSVETVFNDVFLSEIRDMLKNLKNEYILNQFMQDSENNEV